MKRTIKRTIAHLLPQLGKQSVILAYHSIGSNRCFSQSAEDFEHQMGVLARRFRVVPLATIISTPQSEGLPFASITFDDGFRDVYTHAFPILKRYGFPFTLFLQTGFMEGGSAAFNWSPHYAGLEPLTWEQVREIIQDGCVVGSHSHFHSRLSQCTDGQIREELIRSKQILESKLGVEVNTLAYPFGQSHDYDQRVTKAAAEVGYTSAYTTLQTCFRSITKGFEIPRVVIDASDSDIDFLQKISGNRNFVAYIERFNSALIRAGLRRFPLAAPSAITCH